MSPQSWSLSGGVRALVFGAFVAFAMIVALASAEFAAAFTFGADVTPTGSSNGEVVWPGANPATGQLSSKQCDAYNIPDAPVRAFRDADGRVQLSNTHASFLESGQQRGGARRIIVPNDNFAASSLTKDCTQLFLSDHNSSASSYDNYEWLSTVYSTDGQKVYGLVHNEYHGWDFDPPLCPQGRKGLFTPQCWYNALTLATSTNKGDLYTHTSPPGHGIATFPYQYNPGTTYDPAVQATGYFEPSNIVKGPGGYYYALFYANSTFATAQSVGTCVMRTSNLADPTSWRAWGDGDGNTSTPDAFDVQFVKPYPTAPSNPAQHTCRVLREPNNYPLALNESLIYNRYLHKFITVGAGYDPQGGPNQPLRIYYSLSADLVHWETNRLLMNADVFYDNHCTPGNKPIGYPSILDHNSNSRNYETSGQDFDLYFTQFPAATCNTQTGQWTGLTLSSRDLVRVPLRFTRGPDGARLATFEDGQVVNPQTGFDSRDPGSGGGFDLRTGGAYEGNNYVQAAYLYGSTSPHGTFNLSGLGWPNGTDVWYGSAFFITNGFAQAHDNGTILEWSNLPLIRSATGGISLGADHQWRVTHNGQTVGSTFTLPEGQWFWFEVHQKLESDPANGPLSEVVVNGRSVMESAAVNASPDADGAPAYLKVGFVHLTGQPSALLIDRASISWIERGPLGAPPTPTAFSGTEQNQFLTMYWQGSVPTGGGFRIYRKNTDGTWSLRFNNVTTNGLFDNTGLANCTKYEYRISAFDALGHESAKSEPLELQPRGSTAGCP